MEALAFLRRNPLIGVIAVALLVILISIHVLYSQREKYVAVRLKGGMGNRIFEMLAGRYCAEQRGSKFVLLKEHINNNAHENNEESQKYISELFPDVPIYEGPKRHWRRLKCDGDGFDYSKAIITRLPYDDILLDGYFQNEKYMPNHLPDLKVTPNPNLYFVHVRLGDYVGSRHELNLKHYHRYCFDWFKENLPNATCLVFSNDNEGAKKYIKEVYPELKYRISDKSSSIDVLREMAACNGAICANSSLSWLGAFFQKPRGKIFMPNKWMNNDKFDEWGNVFPKWATIVNIN
jgi:hypothetical protein